MEALDGVSATMVTVAAFVVAFAATSLLAWLVIALLTDWYMGRRR